MAFHFHNKSSVVCDVVRDQKRAHSRSPGDAADQKNGVVQVCASVCQMNRIILNYKLNADNCFRGNLIMTARAPLHTHTHTALRRLADLRIMGIIVDIPCVCWSIFSVSFNRSIVFFLFSLSLSRKSKSIILAWTIGRVVNLVYGCGCVAGKLCAPSNCR